MGQSAAKLHRKRLGTDSTVEQCGIGVDVPDDILWEIMIRVPVKDIVHSCVRVCKQWHDIIESKPFWKHKCVVKHKYSRELTLILADEDFKKLYFHSPYQTNLIVNPNAEMGNNSYFHLLCYIEILILVIQEAIFVSFIFQEFTECADTHSPTF